jgi:hypothetical protein
MLSLDRACMLIVCGGIAVVSAWQIASLYADLFGTLRHALALIGG